MSIHALAIIMENGQPVPISLEWDGTACWRWYEVASDRDMGVSGHTREETLELGLAKWRASGFHLIEDAHPYINRITLLERPEWVEILATRSVRGVVIQNPCDALATIRALERYLNLRYPQLLTKGTLETKEE